jgi:small-conductance mechanosensitive channel
MKYGSFFRLTFGSLLFLFFLTVSTMAQAAETPATHGANEISLDAPAAPVLLDGVTLFIVRGTSAFPAEKRAKLVAERIVALADDPEFDQKALRLEVQPEATMVMGGSKLVVMITDADAALEGIDRNTYARAVLPRIGEAIESWRQDREPSTLRTNALFALGATLTLILALWGLVTLSRYLRKLIESRVRQRIRDLQVREFRIVRAQQVLVLLNRGVRVLIVGTMLILLYGYLSSVLYLFPWTRGLAGDLGSILINPLLTIGQGFISFIPNLAFLIILFFVTRYLLKLVHLFFANVADGHVALEEFDPEWAWPTYRLVRILLVAFAVIVAYPYIPGSGSEAFKGVSLFIGVIFSLGSSSLIGNLIAGYTMTYRKAFKIGDRVKVGDYMGDVEQIRMLVTHVRTPKNEEVVIPNSVILNSEVVNYSTIARKQGLILHTTVGIGYETPWRQVEAMLLEAAARTPELLQEPPPFVLQKNLGDFCVNYEVNGYCSNPQAMPRLYTELHRNILDIFNEYGVQIMTPAYEGDPDQPKVVPREQWFAAPARLPES